MGFRDSSYNRKVFIGKRTIKEGEVRERVCVVV